MPCSLRLLTLLALCWEPVLAQATLPVRINCGGWPSDWTDAQGKTWLTDRYSSGGGIDYYPLQDGGANSLLLSTSRTGGYSTSFSYSIPVPNGTYKLNLYFAEVRIIAAGRRVFNVSVNSVTVLSQFDILKETGPYTKLVKTISPVAVTNGVLNIAFNSTVGVPMINGIEVEALTSSTPPALGVTPSTLSFTGAVGGANPAAQSIQIANQGGGNLTWTAAGNQPWLTVTPASGTNAGTVTASVSLTGLAAGTYTGNVSIGGTATATIPVTLTVSPPPSLSVSPSTLSFTATASGSPPASQNLSVTNAATGWSASADQNWISVSPSGTVSVSTSGLAAGTYSATVTITAPGTPGSPKTVPVTLTLQAPPAFSVSPSSLTFTGPVGGAQPATQTLNIANVTAPFSASTSQPWLSVSPTSGSSAAVLTVTASTAGLAAGTYSATVTLSAGSTTIAIPVSLAITPNTIRINSGGWNVDWTDTSGKTWLTDRYYTGGAIDYYAIADAGAPSYMFSTTRDGGYSNTFSYRIPIANGTYSLKLSFVEFRKTATGARVFDVLVNGAAALTAFDIVREAGAYTKLVKSLGPFTVTTGYLDLQFNGRNNNPPVVSGIEIEAAAAVTGPILSATPTSLAFTAQAGNAASTPQSIQVTNIGVGTLSWTATTNQPWLTITPSANSVAVAASAANLTAGSYTATVTINAGTAGAQTIPVALTVTAPPSPQVSPASLTFSGIGGGTNPPAQAIALTNSGGGTLTWTASDDQPWLTITPASGSGASNLTASVSLAGLAAGTYNAVVSIETPGATRTVPVTLTVTPPPTLSVTPQSLSFTAVSGDSNPPAQSLAITNTGGGTLSWTATANQPWISVTPAANSAIVAVNVASLVPGTYSGAVVVTAVGATASPQSIAVSLTINSPPPGLQISPSQLSFAGTAGAANPTAHTLAITNTGAASIAWSAASNQPWLTVTPNAGTDATTLTASVSLTGLAAGTYAAAITIVSASSTKTIPVALTLAEPPPVIQLSPSTLTFTGTAGGSNPAVQSFTVSNTGGGTLNWTAASNQPWLTVTSGPGAANVAVSLTGLAAGSYTGAITVSAPNATTRNLSVALTVDPAPPNLQVSPSAGLTFSASLNGASPAAQNLAISNTGGGTLSWTASANQPWLTVSPASGTNSGAVSVGIASSGLAAGSYTGSITVASANGNATVPITLTVAATALRINAGGWNTDWTDPDGKIWVTDRYNTGGGVDYYPIFDSGKQSYVLSTTRDGYYVWNFSYRIPVPNGNYQVKLHFAEFRRTGAGLRVFNVTQNTLPALTNFDIMKETSAYTRLVKPLPPVAVTNGFVDLAFTGITGPPVVSGIEIEEYGGALTPSLSIAPTSLTFTGTAGGANPPAATIQVTNSNGSAAMPWTASSSAPWLTATPSSTALSVAANLSGLTPGTYSATLTITASGATGSPKTVNVTLTVASPPPALSASPASLSFTAGEPKTITVANTGGGTISWTASSSHPWLTLSPTAGSNSGAVTATPNTSTLAPGTYTTQVTITAAGVAGSPATIPVTLTIAEAPPNLQLSPATLNFTGTAGAASPAPQFIAVTNSGGGTITWSASSNQPWLTLSPASGSGPGAVTASISTAGLDAGVYTATAVIGTKSVGINLTITAPPPVLELAPSALSFTATAGGPLPASQSISVTNSGGGTLTWTASSNQPWLTLTPTSGTGPAAIGAAVSPNGLAPGAYTAVATIGSKTVTVSLTVAAPPILSVTPSSLGFTSVLGSAPPAAKSLSIANSGQGTLTWTASATQPWVSISPASGTGPATLAVTVTPGSLAAGNYTASISVSAPGAQSSPATIPVTLAVTQPTLDLSTSTLTFQTSEGASAAASQSVNITLGAPSIAWTTASTSAWLSATPSSGSGDSPITIAIQPAGFVAGVYTGAITVSAPSALNSPKTVTVTVNVAGGAPSLLTFTAVEGDANPPAQSITFVPGGSTWSATPTQPWITASPAAGSGTGSVTAGVQTAGLQAGAYRGFIKLNSGGATGWTQQVEVRLTVSLPAPQLSLSRNTLSFTAYEGATPASQKINLTNHGGGAFSWTAATTQPWLQLSPLSGTAASTPPINTSVTPLPTAGVNTILPPGASGGATLHNGINLPAQWPPVRTATQEYLAPSYLVTPPAVIPINTGRQLFVDNFLIESTTLTRTRHTPRMFPANPILSPQPGASGRSIAMPFSDGAWYDPSDRKFKLFYYGPSAYQVYLTESADGKSWTLGSPVFDIGSGRDSALVWLDLQETNPARRWKAFAYYSEVSGPAVRVWFSPDGRTWTFHPTLGPNLSDRTTLFFDPFRGKWVDSVRSRVSLPTHGGRAQYTSRARYYSETTDFVTYSPANLDNLTSFWTGPDVLDPAYLPNDSNGVYPELYNLDATPYESLMVGLFSWYYPDVNETRTGPKVVELSEGFSRDGYQWWRPFRGAGQGKAFLPATNVPGTWNGYNTQSIGGGFLVVGDELWFYFSGREGPKGDDGRMSTGLATLRRDGFYSMDAETAEGALTTRPVRFTGRYLFVNVDNPNGQLQAEILDENGAVIPPFSRANSIPISTNKTLQSLSWTGAADLSAIANRNVRFRFYLTNGRLYSFWVTASSTGASNGYIAAGGPGFSSNTDTIGSAVYSSVTPVYSTSELTVAPSAASLPPGSYNGAITISAPGANSGTQSIPVTLTINPVFSVAPAALTFSAVQGAANPPAQSIAINDLTAGTLTWTASANQPWLALSTTPAAINVAPNTASLAPGTYDGAITITPSTGTPRTVTVTLTVTSPPMLQVTPLTLTFNGVAGAANPPTQSVNITNTGTGTLNWTAASNQPWISVTPTSGASNAVLPISVSTTGLAAGTYTGSVSINSGAQSQTVTVTLVLAEPSPILQVSPMMITFNATAGETNPAAQSINIINAGAGTLDWTVASNQPWLTASPSAGSGNGSVSLAPSITNLNPGTHTATITVTSGGQSKTVALTLVILEPPPLLQASPSSLTFAGTAGGSNPASKSITVTNTGGGTLSWTASSNQPWLGITPSSGSNAASVAVTAAIQNLAPGTYTGAVTIAAGIQSQLIAITLTVNEAPAILQISPLALNFNAIAGAANPASRTVSVSNTGGGILNWTASSNQPWLTATPTSGSGAGSVTINATTAGLAAGTYDGAVTFTAGAQSQSVAVTLVISEPPPDLRVSPSALAFLATAGAANPAAQAIAVSNAGGGTLNWSVSSNQPWLAASPSSGTGPAAVSATVETTGLTTGTYSGQLTFTSGTQTLTVTVSLTLGEAAPVLQTTPASLTFAATQGAPNPAPQSIAIANTGGGALSWTASANQPWLQLGATSGTGAAALPITVAVTGLAPGTYNGSVTITAGSQSRNTAVSLTIAEPPPQLTAAPLSLSFNATAGAANPASQSVSITNTGGGTLSWTAASNQPWIGATPSAGSNSGAISVSVATAGLAAGTHTGSLTITAGSQSQTINIALSLAEPSPVLQVSPGSLAFLATANGPDPTAQSIAIANIGGGTLAWSAAPTQPWLTADPTSGTGAGTIAVRAATGALTPGTYSAILSVTAAGQTHNLAVTFTITAPPSLQASPAAINFTAVQGGTNPANQAISIANTGGGVLNWSAATDQPWLAINASSGSGNATLAVSANVAALASGVYTGNVTVSAGTQIQTIPVTLTVTEPAPRLEAAPVSLSFNSVQSGPLPAPQSVTITNTGGGTLSWTASSNQPWLAVTPPNGGAPAQLAVTPTTTALAPGIYSAAISINAGSQTQSITVTLTITEAPPILQAAPLALSFAAIQGAANPSSQSISITNSGGGTLSWTATASQPWLSVAPNAGSGNASITVAASAAGLPAGTHSATITVDAGQQSQVIPVTLTLSEPAPALQVSPSNLIFNAETGASNPAAQSIAVANTGGGTLSWNIASNQPWLNVSPSSGTGNTTPSVSVNTANLAAGTHTASLTITGSNNQSRTVNVILNLSAAPALEASPAALNFTALAGGANPAAQSISVNNSGGGTLTWTAAANQPWLILTPAANSVSVALSTAGLAAGTYTAAVNITAGSQSRTIPVTLALNEAPPLLQTTPASLTFTADAGAANPAAQSFAITNAGGGLLTWTVSSNQPWISASPTLGSGNATIEVTALTGTRLPGTYSGMLTVTAGSQTRTLNITFVIAEPPPVLRVSTNSIQFAAQTGGANPTSRSVSIINAGGGTLNWSAVTTQGWLGIAPASGSGPGSILVSPAIAGLTPGTYSGDVVITSGIQTETVNVQLVINN